MLDVILIRHAEVELSWKSICYGAMDVPLSMDGRTASEKLAATIAATHRPAAIYHSGLVRTAYLAELIGNLCPSIPMIKETRLRERDYGDWQGMTWDEVFQSDPDHFHDLIDDPDRYRPPGGETTTEMQVRMVEWLDALKLGYGDRVAVDYGSSYVNADAQSAIAEATADRGILLGDTAPVTSGQVVPGTVRVIVTRSTASVPSCPDWSSSGDSNFNTNNHSNYGCSINSNLAAMIADPEDLVRGRDNKPLDKNSGKNAVNAYRAKTNGGN